MHCSLRLRQFVAGATLQAGNSNRLTDGAYCRAIVARRLTRCTRSRTPKVVLAFANIIARRLGEKSIREYRGGYTPTVLSPVWETELPPAEFVIAGQQLIAIDVVK